MNLGKRSTEERTLIIGAGIGGLSAAISLAARGFPVTVIEKAGTAGGKLRQVASERGPIDAGPTVFTMPDVFDELLAKAGTSVARELTLHPADILARHAWDDAGYLDLFSDPKKSADAIGDFAGAREAKGYLAFCQEAADIYNILADRFIRSEKPSPASLTFGGGLNGLLSMHRIKPFSTLWSTLTRHFSDQRLCQLFGRYATYVGSSPYEAPATLMLIAHVERMGVWYLEGGMYALCNTLTRIAERLGTEFIYNNSAVAITTDAAGVTGLQLENGQPLTGCAVIFNGDVSALAEGFMGTDVQSAVPKVALEDRSLSAQTWMMATECGGFPLTHHNVFFGADYRHEFETLFKRGRLPEDPTVYLCAQDRRDGHPTDGKTQERVMLLVNAPANGDKNPPGKEEISKCLDAVYRRLGHCGLTLRPTNQIVTTGPSEFARLFPGSGGALYGRASHGWMASFERPGARTRIPRLYLAGGSVHPGAGVPMAAISGQLVAASLESDLGSTARSRTMAISGGTSTASATTDDTASR